MPPNICQTLLLEWISAFFLELLPCNSSGMFSVEKRTHVSQLSFSKFIATFFSPSIIGLSVFFGKWRMPINTNYYRCFCVYKHKKREMSCSWPRHDIFQLNLLTDFFFGEMESGRKIINLVFFLFQEHKAAWLLTEQVLAGLRPSAPPGPGPGDLARGRGPVRQPGAPDRAQGPQL